MVWNITQVEPILALTVQIFFNDLHTPSALVRTGIGMALQFPYS